jgi:hypothetical protein
MHCCTNSSFEKAIFERKKGFRLIYHSMVLSQPPSRDNVPFTQGYIWKLLLKDHILTTFSKHLSHENFLIPPLLKTVLKFVLFLVYSSRSASNYKINLFSQFYTKHKRRSWPVVYRQQIDDVHCRKNLGMKQWNHIGWIIFCICHFFWGGGGGREGAV